jgi:hypothetical protein
MLAGVTVPPKKPAKKKKLPILTAFGDLQPKSWDEKAGTVDVVLASGDKFLRNDYMLCDGPYYMVLGTNDGEVRLDRLNSGRLNLIDTHNSYGIQAALGVVVENSARFQQFASGRALVATIKLTQREDAAGVRSDIGQGILRSISPGIKIWGYTMEGEQPTDGSPPTYRITDWEPREVSLCTTPAQAGSFLLSDDDHTTAELAESSTDLGDSMKTREELAAEAAEAAAKAKTEADAAAARTAAAGVQLTDQARAEAVKAEKVRQNGIRSLCTKLKVEDAFAQTLIDGDVSLADAREKIHEKWEKAVGDQTPAKGGGTSVAETELKAEQDAMRDALLCRGDSRVLPLEKLSEHARKFVNYSLMDVMRHKLERRGIHTMGRSRDEVVELSLHSSSDFPLLLANTANKALRDQYEITPKTWPTWARRGSIRDFKANMRPQLGGAPALEEIPETGAVARGKISEQSESIILKPYGKVVGLSRVAMINDDLGAFTRIPAQFGVSASTLEDDLAYGILTTNAAMADGNALFVGTTTLHKNLLASGAGSALGTGGVSLARALMRQQVGLDGKYLNLTPIVLLVPTALELQGEQLVAAIQPITSGGVNPFAGKLRVVAQPRLDAVSSTVWYAICDPNFCDTVEVSFLEGQAGPRIETRIGFDIDGMEIKCALDVGAKAIDWRGMVKSPGA